MSDVNRIYMVNMIVGEKITTEKNGVYDPFEHREVKKPNSDVRSTANLIKASLGSGLLAVPLAFSNSGYVLGIVGTLIIGFICAHCVHILVKTSRDCCRIERKPLLGYGETCKAAFANGPKSVRPFANTALVFAEFAMFFTYVGVCCVYTVLISDSIKQHSIINYHTKMKKRIHTPYIFFASCASILSVISVLELSKINPKYWFHHEKKRPDNVIAFRIVDKFFPDYIWPVEYYCLILLVPLVFMTQIRHLKWLAPLSVAANILLVATFIICLYYIFGDTITFENRRAFNDPSRFPAFLSTVIFAMEGIGVVMPVENTMKKPQHFLGCPSVLVIAMGAIVFLYSTLGLFGYIRFGDVLRGSITLNLPVDHWPAICAKLFIALSILLTYPLQFFVVIDIFTKYTEPHIKENYRNITQICSRVIGVCICVAIGVALPMLEQIINIVGAFFYSILGLLVPCVIESVFYWENLGRFRWRLWKNLLIITFSLGCLISGCTVAIRDIIHIVHSKHV